MPATPVRSVKPLGSKMCAAIHKIPAQIPDSLSVRSKSLHSPPQVVSSQLQ